MSQVLAKEVAQFNIRVLIAQPGAFTTNMMNAVVLNSQGVSPPYKDSEVGKFIGLFRAGDGPRFEAGGDVEKGCQAIFDVVTGTGKGVGMEKYLRLPLSADCAERTRGQIRSLQETHDVFRNIWENTGHDDGKKRSFPVKN
jgi:hypothetical protein